MQERFRQAAGSDRRLSESEMQRLAESLGAELKIPTSTFGDLRFMFWRYDFSGDGSLDEEEGMMLIEGMMRAYRDSQDPAGARAGMMTTGDIPVKRMESHYEVTKKLGQGGQGAVWLATDRSNGQSKVVKYYDKASASAPADDIIEEFALLSRLDHPRIARTYEIFQDRANIYVVSEPYFGGDLSGIVQKACQAGVAINGSWFAGIWKQACEGVAFLHKNHMMHCDIKEANIMITSGDRLESPTVVVIDFGLASNFGAESRTGGTPGYMPPEVWQMGLWTTKGDTFAMGVVFYTMMGGRRPFSDGARSIDEIKARTLQCRLPTPHPANLEMIPSLITLLEQMFQKDFHQRPTLTRVIESGFFQEAAAGGRVEISPSALQDMAAIQHKSKLHRALLTDLASKENLAQLEELSAMFIALDTDNDGLVGVDEVRRGLAGKLPADETENLITCLVGKSGQVAYTQFMGEMIAARKGSVAQTLWQIFQDLDVDGNGTLSGSEIEKMLKRDAVAEAMRGHSAADILRRMDKDGNGCVSWEEFRAALSVTKENGSVKWSAGSAAEYYSVAHNKWVPCKVLEVRAKDGAIQLNVKPGCWISTREQANKVRAASNSKSMAGYHVLAAAINME